MKRAVRRHAERFPDDFMYELTLNEFEYLRCQFGTSSWEPIRYAPMAFTEHGVIMLASILNSERAIAVNIQIIRIYNKMREFLWDHQEVLLKPEQMNCKIAEHDSSILTNIKYIKQIEEEKQNLTKQKNRKRIGYK